MSEGRINKTLEPQFYEEILAQTSKTIDPSLHTQIKDKYQTFTTFNYRQTYRESRQRGKRKMEEAKQTEKTIGDMASFLLDSFLPETEKKKKKIVIEELAGVKSERRERMKRPSVSFQFIIKQYSEKENYKPSQEEMFLMKQLADLKELSEQTPLDKILKKLYRYMNQAVDFNQLKLLCLVVVLCADVCYQFKDFNRAFFFYNQAKLFASYSEFYHVKTQSLISMGNICMELKLFGESVKLYKKALQYAWKIKSVELQLLLYDLLGNAYYYDGILKEAQYYHKRFTQGQFQRHDSAIKKISAEMLNEMENYLSSLQKKNITSLFIQYINIPIVGIDTIAVASQVSKKSYENYDEEGMSPRRKKKRHKMMEYLDFPEAFKQIKKLMVDDYQFKTEIPNPDVQRIFVPEHKFGRPRKNTVFEQTTQYHKIMGRKEKKLDMSKVQCKSLEKRIEEALSERENKDWWKQIKEKIKMNQHLKVGRMRDKVINSHLSHNKYSEERRRCNSLKTEKIKQSFNKSLLDWIDPPKEK